MSKSATKQNKTKQTHANTHTKTVLTVLIGLWPDVRHTQRNQYSSKFLSHVTEVLNYLLRMHLMTIVVTRSVLLKIKPL